MARRSSERGRGQDELGTAWDRPKVLSEVRGKAERKLHTQGGRAPT